MADHSKPVVYTELEIRSYLPSGWGIHDARSGRWDAKEASWGVDVYDGADNVWKLEVAGADAAKAGRRGPRLDQGFACRFGSRPRALNVV